tara:strand:+ start:1225 stop:2193 length:969 start_codon:yes stop_codon:yes gene_type:complete
MQVLVPSIPKAETNKRYGEASSPCLPSPLLEHPSFPDEIILLDQAFTESAPYADHLSYDKHLSDLIKTYTDGMFEERAHYVTLDDGSNVPLIDTYNSADAFAIGARCELLHHHFDIGPLLLTLLDRSPLYIMTPQEINEAFQMEIEGVHPRQTDDKSREWQCNDNGWDHIYPDWINIRSMDVPTGLPYNLSRIIEACMETDRVFEHPYALGEEIASWPIATCSWYGFEPLIPKAGIAILEDQRYRTGLEVKRRLEYMPDPDQGQGTDPLWMVLDAMIVHAQECSHSTCARIHHEPTEIEDDIYQFGPYSKLLKYISHGRIEN